MDRSLIMGRGATEWEGVVKLSFTSINEQGGGGGGEGGRKRKSFSHTEGGWGQANLKQDI